MPSRVILRFLKVLGRQGDCEYALGTYGRLYYRIVEGPGRDCPWWNLVAM